MYRKFKLIYFAVSKKKATFVAHKVNYSINIKL